MVNHKKILMGMTLDELTATARQLAMPGFVGKQMAQWIYGKHADSIDSMTNISKANRARLAETCTIGAMAPVERLTSVDGTVKYLFPTASGKFVETVFIPENERATLCVSSQVGCKMGCTFCMTGRQGFEENLTVSDILNQVYSLPERERLTNIVFMGQGEPLDNIDNVLRATEILTVDYGYAWSPKRITVSSVGIKGKLERFLNESRCHVAISLHTPIATQRRRLMPAEGQMGIKEVVALLRQHDFSGQRRLSFEYIVFGGENDSPLHARETAKLLRGLRCRVNLIRYHRISGADFREADEAKMEEMRDYLTRHGVFTTIRASRGQDILAACGLLSTARKTEATT